MGFFGRSMLGLGFCIAALAVTAPDTHAVDCGIEGTLLYCDGAGVVIQWGEDTENCNAIPPQVTIKRRPVGGSWTTIATLASSPYTDNPPAGGLGGSPSYQYQLFIDCPACSGHGSSGVLGPISCP